MDWSTPALAQMKPCFVSVIRCPPLILIIFRVSRRTTSTCRGSFPVSCVRFWAKSEGATFDNGTTIPSALETIFCEITAISPSWNASPCSFTLSTMSFPRGSPFLMSGIPFTGMMAIMIANRFLERTIPASLPLSIPHNRVLRHRGLVRRWTEYIRCTFPHPLHVDLRAVQA